MNINVILLSFFLSLCAGHLYSQNIYGFAENYFASVDLSSKTVDTLISFSTGPVSIGNFRSSIDRYNGRYFLGGSLPGHDGNFHVIDLVDLSIESYTFAVTPRNIEYDPFEDRMIFESNGSFYSLDLSTNQMNDLGEIEDENSEIYGQIRTYVPQSNEYFYMDYIYGSTGDPFFLTIDASTGAINCQAVMEETNGVFYAPGGLVTNNLSGEIIGHRNGKFGIVNPCDGTMTKLSEIPDYHSHLNGQMAVYNHANDTYVIPYYSTNSSDKFKIAIVDVYNDEILEMMSQPWGGGLNLQQIYDQPNAPLIYRKDTLFLPVGENYKWYLNGDFIGETKANYWTPAAGGVYSAEVDFREYSTYSTEVEINLTSGSELEAASGWRVYPNPGSDYIFLNLTNTEKVKIKIMALTGAVMFEELFEESTNIQINVHDWPKGPYVLAVETIKDYSTQLILKN